MKKLLLLLFPVIIVSGACRNSRQVTGPVNQAGMVIDGKLWSSVFQQKAAEYQALCIQAYNIARLRAGFALQKDHSKPLAIITDIDETFLDNSPYAVHQALSGKDYDPASWNEWTQKGIADTLPGSLQFFRYAADNNIEVFYVTNREEKEREGTLANLLRFQFPFADNGHLIMKTDNSSKEPRRQTIADKYEIVLLLGDNLADFSALFDKKTEQERSRQVQALANDFGQKFIILPNANYGGWEDAIYLNKRNWSAEQKDSLLRSGLKTY